MQNQDSGAQSVSLLKLSEQAENMEIEDAKFYLRKRYFVAFLVLVGWTLMYLMSLNLSIAIVDMTSSHSVTIGNETWVEEAEYHWSSKVKGLILSAFAWGFLASPLGALAVKKIGGATTSGGGVSITAVVTVLTPVIISWNLNIYLLVRLLEGVFESVAIAASVEVLRVWSPPNERFRLIAGSSSGMLFGIMLSYPICGTIAYFFNWKAVFYITGGVTFLWSIIWFGFVRNNPVEDYLITAREKMYLKQYQVNICNPGIHYPWKEILKSKPVWAYLNDRFVAGWPSSFLAYSLPLYINDAFKVNIKDVGLLASLPQFFGLIGLIGGSVLGDYLKNRGLLNTTSIHKLFLSLAQLVAVAILIIVAFWRNFWANMVFFCIFRLLFTICMVSYEVLPADMGGQYACLLHGLSVTSVGLGLALSPMLMGLIVTEHSLTQWSTYFLAMSAFSFWGSFIFYKFGSGDLQSWAKLPVETEIDKEQNKHDRPTGSHDA